MKTPHPIPYQGSKRNLAKRILSYLPEEVDTLYEPFAGSAAVTILAAMENRARAFHVNDINVALVELWRAIVFSPGKIVRKYEELWKKQQGDERAFYDSVRAEFNQSHAPEHLLYLLARCVKAAVRYNYEGDFNQSPDNRRLGRRPESMAQDIQTVSKFLRQRITLSADDYRSVLKLAGKRDLVYLDPPYQGTFQSGGFRYLADLHAEQFVEALAILNYRKVPFILSYDGRTGAKTFGKALPKELRLTRIEIEAGRSSQATLLGRNHITYESLYLSPSLEEKLGIAARRGHSAQSHQIKLFA